MGAVLVIGGGPAGASFAARMAQLGAAVTLVERAHFPRPRLGESLSPGVRTLLAATGAWARVEAEGFPPARDVHVQWEGDARIIRSAGAQEGLIVDRGRFDQLLLEHARREGVRVLQPGAIVSRRQVPEGWEVAIRHAGGDEVISARLLADARGRSALAGTPRRAMGARTLALHGYWEGHGLPHHAMVAAAARGWCWGVPLPGGRFNAQLFMAPEAMRAAHGETLRDRYLGLIAHSPLAPLLGAAALTGEVTASDATAWLAQEPAAESMIRIGDAALALDPISSSGVQKAVQSALSGAIVANTLLHRPAMARAAIAFHGASLRSAAERHAAWAGAHYASAAQSRPDPFWQSRAKVPAVSAPDADLAPLPLDEIVTLSPGARLVETPCLGAAFVELRAALVHPALAEPVAYLGGQALAPLLDFAAPVRLAELVAAWSLRMPASSARAIAQWLCRRGVLVPALRIGAAA